MRLCTIKKANSVDHWFSMGRACLDIDRLEQLLTVDLAVYCPRQSIHAFRGLAERYRLDELTEVSTTIHGQSLNGDTPELDNAFCFFQGFVDESASNCVPACLLSQVHSFMGILLDLKGEFDEAARSYLRAIWFARR